MTMCAMIAAVCWATWLDPASLGGPGQGLMENGCNVVDGVRYPLRSVTARTAPVVFGRSGLGLAGRANSEDKLVQRSAP